MDMKQEQRVVALIIVITSPTEMIEISERLREAGFRVGDEAIERNAGIRSRLVPIGGGGFIELASELSPGSFVRGPAFQVTPRLASVSYTTKDGARDLQRWLKEPDAEHAMVTAGSWHRQDGAEGYYIGLSPTPPVGDVFFGLREVRLFPLPYADEADSAPVVSRVTITGDTADLWRERHSRLFELPAQGNALHAGQTELIFEQSDSTTELTVTIAVPNPNVLVSLARGKFEFIADERRSSMTAQEDQSA